jgi:hypothetical protein
MEPLFDVVATDDGSSAASASSPGVTPVADPGIPDSLAFTGGGSVPLVLAGAVLVLLGLVLGAGRRRSR